jgi:hypothetical protein
MSNELLRLTGGDAKLTEAQALILAELADEQNAFEMQPARVKIAPGGIGQFLLNDDTAKTFTAIVPISQINRGFWASAEKDKSGAPFCSSTDGVHGILAAEITEYDFSNAAKARVPHAAIPLISAGVDPLPVQYPCATCPMNQWGSVYQKGDGRGKACKEMRRLLLAIDGWALPAILVLPPTSIRAWDAYCSALRARRGAYFGVKTKFELDVAKAASGDTYNVVKVSAVGDLTTEQVAGVVALRTQFMNLVRTAAVQDADYEVGSVSAPAATDDEDLPPM